jgi:transposase-like protein
LQFQRQLGISRYETAFQILHKLRAGMVRPERETIGGEHPVEVDECMIGGRTRGLGHRITDKANVVGAVEVRVRSDASARTIRHRRQHGVGAPFKRLVYAGRVRLQLVKSRNEANLFSFIQEHIKPGSAIRTDGFSSYEALPDLGYKHQPLILANDPELAEGHLPMIHLVFSNLKTWILGTHHGAVGRQHLQAYLNEYTFRFNRRFYPMTAFNSILGLAAKTTAPTYEQLYSGDWIHPASAVEASEKHL